MWGNKLKIWICVLGLIAVPTLGLAATAQSFIPKGWHELSKAEGDLNHDSLPDIVLILANDREDKATRDAQVPRQLVVLFKTNDGYTLITRNDNVVYCKTCGGVMGDPFQGLKIERGSIVLEYYGGSRERWGMTHRLRYQNGDFYLIGRTVMTEDTLNPGSSTTDTNFVTGDQIKTITTADGKTTTQKTRLKRWPLVSISSPEITDALAN